MEGEGSNGSAGALLSLRCLKALLWVSGLNVVNTYKA